MSSGTLFVVRSSLFAKQVCANDAGEVAARLSDSPATNDQPLGEQRTPNSDQRTIALHFSRKLDVLI